MRYVPKGKLALGTDTLFGVVTDQNDTYSQSPPGPTLTVHAPFIVLSETETFTKLPAAASTGAKVHSVDKVAITNSGSDAFTGSLTVDLYATPDGTVASGTIISKIVKKTTIAPGKTITVPITLHSAPALGVGIYDLISVVVQPNGTVTTTDPATAPTFTLTQPYTGNGFDDTIGAAKAMYTYDRLDGAAQHITQLDLTMSITNYGATSSGADQFTLFASTSPTFDSTAIQENSLPLTLSIPHKGTRNFYINFNIPDNGPDNGTEIDYYIFVQVTDPNGAVSMASYPTKISFAGPIPIVG